MGSKVEKEEEQYYQANTLYKACKVREKFAQDFKAKLHAEYVDQDNNWLIDQNIAEFDKKSREKEVALHKAYENPKDYDVQEAEEKFAVERKKYIAEIQKKVAKKDKDIKKLKKEVLAIEEDTQMNSI